MSKIKMLGIAGSLRGNSYNRMLVQNAKKLAPENVEVEIFDLAEIPMYNENLESEMPESVMDLKKKIREADAIIISTPEYNYSMPGVLKNAIDWASRPYGDNSWEGKPLAIMGASIGGFGTVRAQLHLRQSCIFINMKPINRPEVFVSYAEKSFNAEGDLIDEAIKKKVRGAIETLVRVVEKGC